VLITCWSVKGGSGVSVVTAALAGLMAQRHGRAAVVDFGGDQPATLGLPEPSGPGVLDWCDSAAGPEALGRLAVEAASDLVVVPRGEGRALVDPARVPALLEAVRALAGVVVVDAGVPLTSSPPDLLPGVGGGAGGGAGDGLVGGGEGADDPIEAATGRRRGPRPHGEVLRAAGSSLFVTRACYLALRRALRVGVDADGVVLLAEPGRALGRRDVADLLGLPVVGVVEADPAVARAVDAGTLVRRVPPTLARGLRRAG
jgi:hypothetical protein